MRARQRYVAALAWQRRAISLAWRTLPALDQDWQAELATLFSRIQAVLDEGWAGQPTQVVVGLANWKPRGEKLVREAQAMGWHFLLRVRRKVAYRTDDGQEGHVGALVPTRGTRAVLTDTQVLAPEYGGDTRRARRWEAGMR